MILELSIVICGRHEEEVGVADGLIFSRCWNASYVFFFLVYSMSFFFMLHLRDGSVPQRNILIHSRNTTSKFMVVVVVVVVVSTILADNPRYKILPSSPAIKITQTDPPKIVLTIAIQTLRPFPHFTHQETPPADDPILNPKEADARATSRKERISGIEMRRREPETAKWRARGFVRKDLDTVWR